MSTSVHFFSLCTLGLVLSLSGRAIADGHVEFYKEVQFPWAIKEVPECGNSTLCPEKANYTWDYYFDYLLNKGVRSFLLGGYVVSRSKIVQEVPFYPQWDKGRFAALSKRVRAMGGKVLAELGSYKDKAFDKATFHESVAKFTKDYPVDGFRVSWPFWGLDGAKPLKELLEDIKELGMESAFWFAPTDWKSVRESGLGSVADLNFVVLWPETDDDNAVFNTNAFAEKAIENATLAGVSRDKLALEIPLYMPPGEGYSNAIYDLGGDPKGNGSVMDSPYGLYYFFSQPRAIEKIALARKHGLHGIQLRGGDAGNDIQDLYFFDPDSLFYALATNCNSS
ncbi:hypothetical protein FOZ60_007184 [Perkinsus olseni]|uniref:Uncharacterized protein n=1 Tax=Perkinsus olseni TaxID=32597 RepID=A0A7J6NMG2_PEROL|nr:hypothetical protein FOZ60_007184 [Perkinsus olseni]